MLIVQGLTKLFPARTGGIASFFKPKRFVHAVNGVSFELASEQTFALVGESGSGKSTTGRILARLTDPTAGRVLLEGENWLSLTGAALRRRRREVQMIFQNPFSSLDPRWSVERIVAEPLIAHGEVRGPRVRERVVELLVSVGMGAQHLQRYPHQFSGGQRQRIGLARALAIQPRLLIADEPVSALDVSVQAQVLALLREIRARHRLTMIFISHDLSVVRYISNRVGVMYLGELVETGPTAEVFRHPLHPYTAALLSAVPRLQSGRRKTYRRLQGEIPSPVDLPTGCPFHPRCPVAESRCSKEKPPALEVTAGRTSACHFPDRAAMIMTSLEPAPPPMQV